MISKHGPLRCVGQYFTYIYNNYPLSVYLWSYCRFANLAAKVASRFVKGGAPKESQHAVRPNLNGQQHAGQQHAGQPHAGQQQEGQHAVGPHGGPPQSQNVGPHGGPPQGQHVGPHEGQQGGVDRLNQASIVANIGSSAAMAISILPKSSSSSGSSDSSQDVQTSGSPPTGNLYTRRELEDNEDPFKRDLDVEELFGRESYPLDERDVVDNGDLFVRDFGTGELFGREYDFLDERDIIDDEDLFVRDLEAEEFFGREYDFLD